MLIDFIILITNITVVISAISRPVSIGLGPPNFAYQPTWTWWVAWGNRSLSFMACRQRFPRSQDATGGKKILLSIANFEKTKSKSCVKLEFETTSDESPGLHQTIGRSFIVEKFMKECKICGINHGHLSEWVLYSLRNSIPNSGKPKHLPSEAFFGDTLCLARKKGPNSSEVFTDTYILFTAGFQGFTKEGACLVAIWTQICSSLNAVLSISNPLWLGR